MSGFGKIFPSRPIATVTPITPPASPPDLISIPWFKWFSDRLGWTEFDHDKELSKGWKYCGLDYTTVIGSSHAWCAMALNTALIESGYKGTGSAAASSFEKYGTPCDWIQGAIVPIRHVGGSHHVTLFHHWVIKENRVAACLGGNQQNSISIAHYNLSGNSSGHEECSNGPKWPIKA